MTRPSIRSRSAAVACAAGLVAATPAVAADIILTEYNAVSSDKWLGNPALPECEGPLGFICATNEDTFFGRIIGNGGNWFELAIITDHLDMRGWRLEWQEVLTGRAGIIFLSNNPLLSDLRAGTILTVTEWTTAQGGLDTDTSFDPCTGDWWININTFDPAFVAFTTSNVPGDGPGNFTVGNGSWVLAIRRIWSNEITSSMRHPPTASVPGQSRKPLVW